MIENLEILAPAAVLNRVHDLSDISCRFVTITCCVNPDASFDIFYSFDRDYKLFTIKTTLQPEKELPSISGTYLAASFAENEISELFGVKITGMAIDYGGRFILSTDSPEQPFGNGVIIERKDGDSNAR